MPELGSFTFDDYYEVEKTVEYIHDNSSKKVRPNLLKTKQSYRISTFNFISTLLWRSFMFIYG